MSGDPPPAPPRKRSDKRRRNHVVALRLLTPEREAVQAAADQLGLSVGAYIRRLVFTHPTGPT